MIKAFLLQLQFFTRIPIPVKIKFDEKTYAKGMVFAPVTGLIIGSIIGGIFYLIFYFTGKTMPAVILAIISEIIITGGLHLDGLADTFDGVFSNRTREKILEIMKDSRIGTTGALALILTILSKTGILLSIDAGLTLKYLFIVPAVSRMNIVWAAGIFPYAKEEGIGRSVIKYTGIREIIIASVIASVISIIFIGSAVLLVMPVSILFGLAFMYYINKKIGGITGDTIGALIELTEVAVLLALFLFGNFFI